MGKEKDRRAVDPPPVVQLLISHAVDPSERYIINPHFFMKSSLTPVTDMQAGTSHGALLAGTTVSSCHRLKDPETDEWGAYFVFGDLSAKIEGTYILEFNLFESREDEVIWMGCISSDQFNVYSSKAFPGMMESTTMTKKFQEQGLKLRVRKEPRSLLRKRGPAFDDYEPKKYRARIQDPDEDSGSPEASKYSEQQQAPHQTTRMQNRYSVYSQESSSPEERRLKRQQQQQQQQQQQPSFAGHHVPSQHPLQSYNDYNSSNYAHSPQEMTTPVRDQFFSNQLSNTHIHDSPQPRSLQFDMGNQRPSPTYYHAHSQGPLHSTVPILSEPNPLNHRQATANYQAMGYPPRTHISHGSLTGMLPPSNIGRNPIPSGFPGYRRDTAYETLPGESLSIGQYPEQGHFGVPLRDPYESRPPAHIVTTSQPEYYQ
uniref:Velvet 3 n=1 Tax=Botryotinia fuckeliana TaxID=40559 RepID=L0PRX2_BOTFU|nr:Velvet 3 [Botrytis cinerea]